VQIDSTETPTLTPIGKVNAATGAATAALLFASAIFGRLADSRPKNSVTRPTEPGLPAAETAARSVGRRDRKIGESPPRRYFAFARAAGSGSPTGE
jgi:hypothetical protein